MRGIADCQLSTVTEPRAVATGPCLLRSAARQQAGRYRRGSVTVGQVRNHKSQNELRGPSKWQKNRWTRAAKVNASCGAALSVCAAGSNGGLVCLFTSPFSARALLLPAREMTPAALQLSPRSA